jgi:hypothetical protein
MGMLLHSEVNNLTMNHLSIFKKHGQTLKRFLKSPWVLAFIRFLFCRFLWWLLKRLWQLFQAN